MDEMVRSKTNRSTTPSEDDPEFIDIGSVNKLTKEEVKQTQEPIPPENVDEYTAYYAIGRVNGVIRRGGNAVNMSDGASVLYISEDGKAYERMFDQDAKRWDQIPRVSYSKNESGKKAKEWMKIHLNKLKRTHKRLDTRRTSTRQ